MTNNYQAGRTSGHRDGTSAQWPRSSGAVLRLKKGIPSTDAREQRFYRHAIAGLTVIDDIYLGTEIARSAIMPPRSFYAQGDKIQGVFTPNENTLGSTGRSRESSAGNHIGFDYNDYLHDALTSGDYPPVHHRVDIAAALRDRLSQRHAGALRGEG